MYTGFNKVHKHNVSSLYNILTGKMCLVYTRISVYREIFVPILFSPLLSVGKLKTGRIPMFYIISL